MYFTSFTIKTVQHGIEVVSAKCDDRAHHIEEVSIAFVMDMQTVSIPVCVCVCVLFQVCSADLFSISSPQWWEGENLLLWNVLGCVLVSPQWVCPCLSDVNDFTLLRFNSGSLWETIFWWMWVTQPEWFPPSPFLSPPSPLKVDIHSACWIQRSFSSCASAWL